MSANSGQRAAGGRNDGSVWTAATRQLLKGAGLWDYCRWTMEILPPSDGRIFKLILAPDEAEPVRIDLISAILKRPVVSAKVRNSEIPPEDIQEKAERLDVNCRIDDGTPVDLEMQASRIQEDAGGGHQNLMGKSIYYLCDLTFLPARQGDTAIRQAGPDVSGRVNNEPCKCQ